MKVASTIRLSLEAGPLHLALPLESASARDLLGGGPPFTAAPGPEDDPVFLQGEGVLHVGQVSLFPEGERRFRVEATGTIPRYNQEPVGWRYVGTGRLDQIEVENRSEKAARGRLAELLPRGGESPRIEAHEVPEIGLWLIDADWT